MFFLVQLNKKEHVQLFMVDNWKACQLSTMHKELNVFFANPLTEVCHDVKTEPDLQPLTGETLSHTSANSSDGARLA